jgi:hypothetical protein
MGGTLQGDSEKRGPFSWEISYEYESDLSQATNVAVDNPLSVKANDIQQRFHGRIYPKARDTRGYVGFQRSIPETEIPLESEKRYTLSGQG